MNKYLYLQIHVCINRDKVTLILATKFQLDNDWFAR